MKLFKYEFTDKAEFDSLVESIQIEENGRTIVPNLKATIELGFIKLQDGTYDEQGNLLTPPVHSTKYCIDLIWKDDAQPLAFNPYEVFPKTPKHTIA